MRVRTEMKRETTGRMNRIRKADIKTNERMQGTPPASSSPINATNAINSMNATNPINTINAINAKESEVRTVMGGIFGRRIYNILNLKSAISNLKLLRTALMAVLVVMFVTAFAGKSESIQRVSYWSPNGQQTLGGITTDNINCGSQPTAPVTTQSSATECTGDRVTTNGTGMVYLLIDTTQITIDKLITGVSHTAIYEDRAGCDSTFTYELGYVTGGTFTSLGSVSKTILSVDANKTSHTVDLSSISGRVPANSYIAFKLTRTAGNCQWRIRDTVAKYVWDEVDITGDVLTVSANTPIQTASVNEGATGVLMQRFQVDATNYGAGDNQLELTSLTIEDNGTATKLTAHIYIDTVAQNTLPPSAVLIGSTTEWYGSVQTINLTGGTVADRTITAGTPKYIYIVYDIPMGQGGKTIQSVVTNIGVKSPDLGRSFNYSSNLINVNTCTETASVSLDPLPHIITGPVTVTVTLGGTGGSNPMWSTDKVNWYASGTTYTPPVTSMGRVSFYAKADGVCSTVYDPNNPTIKRYDTTNVDAYKIDSCSDCHYYPPEDTTTRNNPAGAVVGDHEVHYNFVCSTCHTAPATETSADYGHRNGNIQMATGSTGIKGGFYDKNANNVFDAGIDDVFAQVTNPTTSSCINVSCHGGTGTTTPQWGVGSEKCANCHSNSVDAGDGVPTRRAVIGEFNVNIGHLAYDVATATDATLRTDCNQCHQEPKLNHVNNQLDSPFEGVVFGSEDYCFNCHNPTTPIPFTDNQPAPDTYTPWKSTFNHSAGATCFDCHGDGAGNARVHGGSTAGLLKQATQYDTCFQCHNATINKTNLASEQDMDNNFNGGGVYQNNWNTIPNIQAQFSTTNYAYHPLFATGKNQPADNLNNDWQNSNYRKDDNAPGGPFTGLDNNFVDGWTAQSLVTCTDCHDNNSGTGARGPHGSAQPWILKGMDKTVTVTTAGAGTIQPNQNADTTKSYIAANFCVNCHRADVYGWGSNTTPGINGDANETFSRVSHLGGAMRTKCTATQAETGQGGYRNIGCMNCHGGGEVAGIHGSNLGKGSKGNDPMGIRFMNGNSWAGHTLGQTNGSQVGCFTGTPPAIGANMSGCSGEHTGGKFVSPNYYY